MMELNGACLQSVMLFVVRSTTLIYHNAHVIVGGRVLACRCTKNIAMRGKNKKHT